MYIVPKIEVREAEDIIDFATIMDFILNFIKTRLQEKIGM